jgi:hypothetical protein
MPELANYPGEPYGSSNVGPPVGRLRAEQVSLRVVARQRGWTPVGRWIGRASAPYNSLRGTVRSALDAQGYWIVSAGRPG